MSLGDLKLGKIMLVCSEACGEVEKCLLSAGCWVVKLNSGEAAISRAQRENFDAAVLVSTGKAMDLAETVLNLRDVNESMQIVVVTERKTIKNNFFRRVLVAHPVPRTQLLTIAQLESHFMPTQNVTKAKQGRIAKDDRVTRLAHWDLEEES